MTEREHCEKAVDEFARSTDPYPQDADEWWISRRGLVDLIERERARARNEALKEAASLAQAATDDDWDCGEVERRIRALVKP